MGILYLFSYLYRNYRHCLLGLNNGEVLSQKKFPNKQIQIDSFHIDLNAIIHPVCKKLHDSNNIKFLHKKEINEKQIFSAVCKQIDLLKRLVNPSKELVIAIDGSAGLCKILQQKMRRFKAASERSPNQTFDTNKITTGSEFMSRLSFYIHNYIQRQMLENHEWMNIQVVFSNEKVASEGEQKLIRRMEQNPNLTYCVYSPDADLIMLTLGLTKDENIKKNGIYIIRENIYTYLKDSMDCDYFIIDVVNFRNKLVQQLRWLSIKHEYKEEYAIYDYILVCFLLGNDFLPRIPSIDIADNGIDIILDLYPRIATLSGHLVYKNKTGELCINVVGLKMLLSELAKKEKDLLLDKYNKHIKFPDTILQSCIIKDNDDNEDVDFKTYRNMYNKIKLENDEKQVCKDYVKGMLFVLRYYIQQIPNWHWFYPYNYSPLFTDLKDVEFDGETTFTKNEPLNPLEQLIAVLPPKSADILPEPCRYLITSEKSPIKEYYPETFEIDMDGKRQEYEGHPILPNIDIDKIKKAYNDVKHLISEQDLKRAKPGKTSVYNKVNGNIRINYC